MLRPHGYSLLIDPETGTVENDTMKCGHCQKATVLKAGVRPEDQGGFCRKCMRLVCSHCAGGECKPWEQELEDWEKIGNRIIAGGR